MTDEDGGEAAADSTPSTGGRPPVLVDIMCGKLATYLRLCGYDAAYALDRGVEADDRLLSLAATEERVLLTRDRELADRATADAAGDASRPGAVRLSERDVLDQLRELDAAGFPVALAAEPARCGSCNGPVERVASPEADGSPGDRPDYVPDDVGTDRPGWRCTDCGQWFWKGGHWDDVAARLDGL